MSKYYFLCFLVLQLEADLPNISLLLALQLQPETEQCTLILHRSLVLLYNTGAKLFH